MRQMKKFAVLIIACSVATLSSQAQSPSLIQVGDDLDWALYYLGSGGSLQAGQYILSQLPNPSLAGNMLMDIVTFDHTASTPTVTDDQNDTYSLAATCSDTTGGEEIGIYYLLNAPAGVRQIKTTYHVTTLNQGAPAVAEWTNVSTNASTAFDGSSCGFANSTTVQGSTGVTPGASGDLVVQFAWNDDVGLGSGGGIGIHYTPVSQSNINWTNFLGTWAWAEGGQWGVYNSTTTLNPQMTVSTAGFVSLAVFFKSASAGTPMPSGIRIVARKNVPFTNYSPWNPTPLKVYFPCPSTANLLVADFAGANQDMTAVSDSNADTWASNHAQQCDSGNNTCVHNWSTSAASPSPAESVTFTFNAYNGADSVELYCVQGAAASAFDTSVAGAGNQTAAGNWTSVSITPSTSNGLVLMDGSQYSDTATGFAGSGQNFEGCFWSAENISNGGCASNNAWGAYYNPNQSQVTWTATEEAGVAVGIWAVETDAYKGAGGSASAPAPPTNLMAVPQ
jgi:hypothetical protein